MASAVQEPPAAVTTTAAPVTAAAAPAIAPPPAAGAIQRGSRWTQFKAWLRLAYTDLGSKEHHVLLEWIIWMVIVSVVVTVLQHDIALDELYHPHFRVVEGIIFLVFAVDYGLNMYYAASKRTYAFSFSGVVDLLAILPSFLIFVDLSAIKFLRALRFLRFLRLAQVIKALRHRQHLENEEENNSMLMDLQLAVIGISALLLLVPDDALRNMLLACTLFAAITTGIRRWLVYKQMPTVSILVLVTCVIGAMWYAVTLDGLGHQDWAVWFLVGSVIVAATTWFQIEAPAGI
jgi:hypothetical protein